MAEKKLQMNIIFLDTETDSMEEWKEIGGREGKYQVSNLGRIKSLARTIWYGKDHHVWKHLPERILRGCLNKCGTGYLIVHYGENPRRREYIHKLVAIAFLPNPNNYPCINHKDGNTLNNCVENLEWCSYQMNTQHAIKELKTMGIAKNRKQTVDTKTGIVYPSLWHAYHSQPQTIKYSHFTQLVCGYRENTTHYKLVS